MSGGPDARPGPRPVIGAGLPPGPLRFVVEAETQRVLSDARLAPDPRRLAQGWERRFVADEARVTEMVRLYRELGYETAVDPVRPADLDEDCGDCRLVAQLRLRMIYTRPGPTPRSAPKDREEPR